MTKSIPVTISHATFIDTYWHRSALAAYCRTKGLPTCGSKSALSVRIAAHLLGKPQIQLVPTQRRKMPDIFTPDTLIGENWHCSQPLRAFFQSQTKMKFTFTNPLRTFIANGTGKTLANALHHWETTKNQPTVTIEPQFEYNRFMCDFFKDNTNADIASAITAWRIYRDTPKSQRV